VRIGLRRSALFSLAFSTAAVAAQPAPAPPTAAPTGGREPAGARVGVTPTRWASLFGGLERDIADAVKRRDTAALDRLLLDDFDLLASSHPEQPVGRDDWQEAVLGAPPRSFRISGVSAHMAGENAAVVSLVYEQQAKAPAPSGRFMFVDLWLRAEGRWRLQARYASPSSDAPVPGWVAQPVFEKR
jgi:hypothetical protein